MKDGATTSDGLGELAPIRSSSVAVEAAKALRNEILRRAEHDMFLGSEDDLVQRLGISRPTFRQAARLLEYEELLIIRRGAGGGFFGRKPSADVVARMAGIYLLARGTSFEEVVRVQLPLEAAAVREIADNPDLTVRARAVGYLDEHPHLRRPYDVPGAVRAINGFWRLMAELAANRALMLFVQAAQAYGAKSAGLMLNAARLDAYAQSLREMAAAIRDGDAERAIELNNGRGEQMIDWVREDSEG